MNDEQVLEQYARCSVKNKQLTSISKSEEAELAALVTTISTRLDEPEDSPDAEQRYMVIANVPDNVGRLGNWLHRGDKVNSDLYTWGNQIDSDKFDYDGHLVEFTGNDIAISGGKLTKHLARLLFIDTSNSLVKVHADDTLEVQQLDCLDDKERSVMKALKSKLIEIRDKRIGCKQKKRNDYNKLGGQFESAIAKAKTDMNSELSSIKDKYTVQLDDLEVFNRDGKQVSGSTAKLGNLRMQMEADKQAATSRFQNLFDIEMSKLAGARKASDQEEATCLSLLQF